MDKNKNQINKILSFKYLYDGTCRKAFELITTYKENDPIFYNISMAKLLILMDRETEATEYLLNLLEIDPNYQSIYYNLYKVEVKEDHFDEAFLDLHKYQQLRSSNKVDVTLPLTMLEMYLDMDYNYDYYLKSDYSIRNSNIFVSTNIDHPELKQLYAELIEAFNQRNFKEMKKILSEMNAIINTINYPIEVNTIEYILNAIIRKEKELLRIKTKTKTF